MAPRSKRQVLPVLGSLLFLAGCQNSLEVRVQRCLIAPDLYLREKSEFGRRLRAAVGDLEKFKESCGATWQAIEKWARGKKQPDMAIRTLGDWPKEVERASEEAQPWIAECNAYFLAPDFTREVLNARQTIHEVGEFLSLRARRLQQAAETAMGLEHVKKTLGVKTGESSSLTKAFSGNQKTVDEALRGAFRSENLGFGGFHSTDVFVINPSDPKYADILRNDAWQNVSARPFTFAFSGVSGDSSIMFVFEHPGQIRVYQVSMDPTQITRNIGLLLSKATAAAAKYMTGGLAP